ncbi:MAG: hypothetical protein NC247_07725 [Ruminococcus flavefaciens]|nr:hypothetical protein [Ruminococcus flavefaciens]MCM1362758.1 hypothetical protein [Clostridiales bacterium]
MKKLKSILVAMVLLMATIGYSNHYQEHVSTEGLDAKYENHNIISLSAEAAESESQYTIEDIRNLQDFLLARETSDLSSKDYDLNDDDRWDVFDLCLMKRHYLKNHKNKVLVAYFSYSENIGDTSNMTADVIASASMARTSSNTEGNLQVMAHAIQEEKSADVFHIVVTEPYDYDYNVMHDRAIEEQNKGILPALTDTVDNLEQYDVIYLGTPVWAGALPQPVVTFLTENDLSGKTIIPFGIHMGSRFGSMINQIKNLCPDSTLAEGFTIHAGTANDEVKSEFKQWIGAVEKETDATSSASINGEN